MLNCPEMMQMFRWMEERGVILSVDLAEGAIQVPEMEEIIQECPRLKIAVGHFGMVTLPDWKEQIKLARHPNVMIESGGITWLFNDEFYPFKGAIKAIREAAELVGMEKLMWGSDYPLCGEIPGIVGSGENVIPGRECAEILRVCRTSGTPVH